MLEFFASFYFQSEMACACGEDHTITLSNDGTVYSFGRNEDGELGLGHNNSVSLPTPIPNLPNISEISCGSSFTVCVDCEGFIWSFGYNNWGQLGTGNKTKSNVPHSSVSGTSFSKISKISTGNFRSLFQNDKGEIFLCGCNFYGACGLGFFNASQITPSLIPNAPENIIQFVCGSNHSLFLNSEGNVYSVGSNEYGQLGLGHNTKQNELNKIGNIPPIKIISCTESSSYLIDFEGNLWSFGSNDSGQLGHGDITNKNSPKKISTLKDIQQISGWILLWVPFFGQKLSKSNICHWA